MSLWCWLRGHDWRYAGTQVLAKLRFERCERCRRIRSFPVGVDWTHPTLKAQLLTGDPYDD